MNRELFKQLSDGPVRSLIIDGLEAIEPIDDQEQQDIKETILWIYSGEPIFRIAKPDIPPRHLCAYFALLDQKNKKMLLVDHKKSGLWIPPGGHVEEGEDPRVTVERECEEELGIEASFIKHDPFFLSVNLTVGVTAGHYDVNMWYLLEADMNASIIYDENEFNEVQWFSFYDIPLDLTDQHMERFLKKINTYVLQDL